MVTLQITLWICTDMVTLQIRFFWGSRGLAPLYTSTQLRDSFITEGTIILSSLLLNKHILEQSHMCLPALFNALQYHARHRGTLQIDVICLGRGNLARGGGK